VRALVPLIGALAFAGAIASFSVAGLLLWSWTFDDAVFFVFAATLVLSGLGVVLLRDIIRAGLSMIVCFGALAGIYVIVGAPLVAAAQVLVYIGAISVLVLFAIMLTQTKAAPSRLVFQTQVVPAAVASILFAVLVAVAVLATDFPELAERVRTATDDLARLLFEEYVLAFEVVSVLLLSAVVGGVFLAKRERPDGEPSA
jgi:NADH:ubiquinone oxidoreductase subunit 6 (subunit J)